ncbi:MAG: thioredoxin family protein [Gammaproteobacteria bacterium]|nr:thioredoxin family protein [Gammaproteobacteria bacterium]
MDVMIVATKTCNHRPNLEHELRDLEIAYRLCFVEDEPEVAQSLGIRHSPNVVVDGEVVFRGQPTEHELREFFAARPSGPSTGG